MRPVDADALKAKWYEINDIDENDRGARFVGYTEIARLIDQAPTVSAEAEWIPVSERLPGKDGCYLVCMSWDYHDMDVFTWADGWNCIRRINGKVNREYEIDGTDIIAWMPLPEPYKDKERKDGNDKTETRP